MTHNEKIYAITGKLGKVKTSKRFGMTYPTFLSRLNNPGDWKASEIEVINQIYMELFK
jgi:hypothetical protein